MTARPTIVVVGLGPAGPELITPQTSAALADAASVVLRTRRHPAAEAISAAMDCDDLYEREDTFDAVYRAITERVVGLAGARGRVCYAVPGSPRVLERSVEHLLHDDRVDVELIPAMSFLDLAWARLGIDPVEAGVRLVDGHTFAESAAGERGPMLVAHCHNRRVLSDIKLSVDEPGDTPVLVVQRLGGRDEAIVEVAWQDLDRSVEADHLTSLWIPQLRAPVAAELVRFDDLVHTLRAECPWDRSQTHASLRRHLLEESYEVLEAIDACNAETGAGFDDLCEELGDLLFQVFLHAAIAAESGWFELADVARGVHDKLTARHPHVFGDAVVGDASELAASWEAAKVVEKGRSSVLDGMPAALPALMLAEKVLKKAASVGIGPDAVAPPTGPGPTLAGSVPRAVPTRAASAVGEGSGPGEQAIGEALFALVARARSSGVDPEMALRARTATLMAQVRAYERLAAESDIDVISATAETIAWMWARVTQNSGPIPS